MSDSPDGLEPIAPSEAVELYLADIENDKSEWTHYSHSSRLSHFEEWCDEQDVENLNELGGRDMHRYKLWRRSKEDSNGDTPNSVTMKTQLDTLRVFVRFCESIDAIAEGTAEKILSPSLDKHENEKDEMLDPDAAEAILDHLDRFEYASRDHVTLLLLWHCLLRRGGLRAVDQDHFDSDDHSIEVEHQPETDTPLKNKDDGHRFIGLKPRVTAVIDDYIDTHRVDTTDDFNRNPLVTTVHGRPHPGSIQTSVYAWTRPCKTNGGECPHGRAESECDAAQTRGDASKCPSSVGPHALRRGAITHWLQNDAPLGAVSDRCNADPSVISKHYDQMTQKAKMEQRREYIPD